jgi:hypothetical protein
MGWGVAGRFAMEGGEEGGICQRGHGIASCMGNVEGSWGMNTRTFNVYIQYAIND